MAPSVTDDLTSGPGTNQPSGPDCVVAWQKNPLAALPNAPPQGGKVGGRSFFSRQDAAENGQDQTVFSRHARYLRQGKQLWSIRHGYDKLSGVEGSGAAP